MASKMCQLRPCVLSHTSFVHSALHAPLRPSSCKARLGTPRSSCTHSPFLHSLQRRSLHVCNAKDQSNDSSGDTRRGESLLAVFNFGLEILNSNFLPFILVSAVALGIFYPSLGQQLYRIGLSKWATFGVFFISGVTLQTSEVGDALQAWQSLLFGVVSSLAITPWIAILILQFPIDPREFGIGLALFCCMPTTLSSGVTLTKIAGANTALALSLTLVSNLLGVLTIPILISKAVAPNLGVSIHRGPLLKNLLQISLVPLLIGKAIRVYAYGFIDERKKELAIISAIFLGLVPLMQVSCGRNLFISLKKQSIAAAAVLGLATHCVLLLWNFLGIHTLHIYTKESKNLHQQKSNAWAIILTASQKTLPIAIAVIGSLHGLMGNSGLLILPCLIAHLTQIVFDSFLVRLWIEGDLQKAMVSSQ